jgi:uncharacterized protein YjbI with pentapeptide repeats
MASSEQLKILWQGADSWNKWRDQNPDSHVDLIRADLRETKLSGVNLSGGNIYEAQFSGANLSRANLSKSVLRRAHFGDADLNGADLSGADLSETWFIHGHLNGANLIVADLKGANLLLADLKGADLSQANLSGADLSQVDLNGANLSGANLSRAKLNEANLREADLNEANLSGADIRKACLARAILVDTVVEETRLSGSSVYGINVWDLKGEFEEQRDLIITHEGDPVITVDNINIAQFIYLILNNEEIRDVINVLTSKSVLILGRFSIPERKAILDALRNKLRENNLLPIVFDFDRPTDKDFTETIKTLAGLCYFVIADVTNPKSSPLELQATVPDYQIPFVPIIQEGESPFAMMVDLQKKYNWVLNTVSYDSEETLMKVLKPLIIDPAMKKRNELRIIKAQVPEVISGKDFLDKGKISNRKKKKKSSK